MEEGRAGLRNRKEAPSKIWLQPLGRGGVGLGFPLGSGPWPCAAGQGPQFPSTALLVCPRGLYCPPESFKDITPKPRPPHHILPRPNTGLLYCAEAETEHPTQRGPNREDTGLSLQPFSWGLKF